MMQPTRHVNADRRYWPGGLRSLVFGVFSFVLLLSSCSDSDEPSDSQPPDDDVTDEPADTADAGSTEPDPDANQSDADTAAADSFDFDTGGLIDYLDASFPDTGFSSEISLLFVAEDQIMVNLQTSFFEPEEAVALCEAVAGFVDAAGGPDLIEFVSTSGTEVANRASAGSPCVAGEDL